MDTERALSCHIRNRFMLTRLACPIKRWNGIALDCRYYATDRFGVMAQNAENMLMKIMNE